MTKSLATEMLSVLYLIGFLLSDGLLSIVLLVFAIENMLESIFFAIKKL